MTVGRVPWALADAPAQCGPPVQPLVVPVLGDGQVTASVWAVDGAGNPGNTVRLEWDQDTVATRQDTTQHNT